MIDCLSDAYQCSTLSINAHHLSFLAFGVLVDIYMLFEERFLAVSALNSKKLAQFLVFLYILSQKGPSTAFYRTINWFFSTILIMCFKLKNGEGCGAIFALRFEYFHEGIISVGPFDELKLCYMTL